VGVRGSDCLERDIRVDLILNGGNDRSRGHALKSTHVSMFQSDIHGNSRSNRITTLL
jgi:hypothetical protein